MLRVYCYLMMSLVIFRDESLVNSLNGGNIVEISTQSDRFCNDSAVITFNTPCRPCSTNSNASCPEDAEMVTHDEGVSCLYSIQQNTVRGCQHICRMQTMVLECCKGRWGDDCQECPGGASNPCMGHGVCSEGIKGNGTCTCQPEHAGTACELCAPGRYGLDCSQETCHNIDCPEFSQCVQFNNSGPVCQCLRGFKMINMQCEPTNPCAEEPSPCHPMAVCIQYGPGAFQCKCQWGYKGDGFICTPIDPCQVNYGYCPDDTTLCVYDQPGISHCECREGYQSYVEDIGCDLIDMCALNTTRCDRNAECATTSPGIAECFCKVGYIGDGQECFGNIIERVQDLMVAGDLKGQFSYALSLLKFAYYEALTMHGPFTIFLPTDDGFHTSLNTYQMNNMMSDVNYARHLLRQHILARQLTVEEMNNATMLYTLQGTTARLYYKRGELSYRLQGFTGRARVLQKDIVAVNGIIHVVDKLLDKPPDIIGSSKRSIMEVLSADKAYNQLETLMESVGIDNILKSGGPWTVFAPSFRAWNNLPEGSVTYLLSEEGQEKLKMLLRNHIVQPPVVTAAELVNTHRFLSTAHIATTVAVTTYGQLRLNEEVNITQSDIHASNGYIHHIDGILLPEALQPLLPHRCDLHSHRLIRGTCGPCGSELHCPGKDDVPVGRHERGCRYWVNLGKEHGGYKPLIGCREMCNKTFTVPRCCENFYGPDCQPCPGGFQNPCYGRGKCFDGFQGSGFCNCDTRYYGTICEFCTDPTKYGPSCNKTCSCLHGRCDNRVMESRGTCQPSTCYRGYMGNNCDIQQRKCSRKLRCHAHAECVKMSPRKIKGILSIHLDQLPSFLSRKKMKKIRKSVAYCQCKQGYTGTGTVCIEIDPCKADDRGGCHSQALCIKTGPGLSRCQCDEGFVGDGFYCYPSITCNSSLDCDDSARCMYVGPGQFQCVCVDGYHGNGTYCVMNDICKANNGGCYPEASCVATGPGQANCSCPEGLGGDGFSCYGDLQYELKKHQLLTTLSQLMERIPYDDNLLVDLSANYTLLAPENSVLDQFIQTAPENFFEDEDNLLLLSRYHLLPAAVTADDLRTLYNGKELYTLNEDHQFSVNITAFGEELFINDAKIIQPGIVALNGYIHIIDQVLEPYPISNVPHTLEQLLQQNPEFSLSLQYLKKFGMISIIENMESYTLFIPINDAWGKYKNSVSRRLLEYLTVPLVLMTWEMVKDHQLVYSILDESPNHRLIFTEEGHHQVLFNGVELVMTASNMLTKRGVLHGIKSLPDVDLVHCDVLMDDTKMSECGDCEDRLPCPNGYSPMTPEPVIVEGNCTYNITRLIRQQISGCQQICHKTVQVQKCCPGYYGLSCTECPGGADNPCSNHGNCTEGILGHGHCTCDDGYVGDACEECITEECLNDPCLNQNGGCDELASCSVSIDGEIMCDCLTGYTGDGYDCYPMCDINNGGCPAGSTCNVKMNGTVTCFCPDGQLPCLTAPTKCDVNNGGCSLNAICKDNGSISCQCNEGYVGNGTLCNQDMWSTLLTISLASIYAKLIQSNAIFSESVQRISHLLQDSTQNLTVFVPVDTGLNQVTLEAPDLDKYISTQWIGLYPGIEPCSYQAIDGSPLVISLSTSNTKENYLVNGIAVVDTNIPVTNGILHLLAAPFSILPQAQQQSQKTSGATSILAILGTVILLLVLIFITWKTKHKTRFLIDRMRQCNPRSFTFANFTANKFNFVRFMLTKHETSRTSTDQYPEFCESRGDEAMAQNETTASSGSMQISFNNPVFSQCQGEDEDQLIFK